MLNREPAGHDVAIHVKRPGNIAGMDVQNADLAGNHARQTDVGQQVNQFVFRREGTAVIAHGNLDAQAFGHHKDIFGDLPAHRRGREAVVARVHPRAHAFGRKRPHLCQQVFNRTRNKVGARHPHDVRRPAGDEFGQHQFGRPGHGAAFAAAPRHVDVLIEEARRKDLTFGVNGFKIRKFHVQIRVDGEEAPVYHQHVTHAQIIRGKNVRVANQNCFSHGLAPCGALQRAPNSMN